MRRLVVYVAALAAVGCLAEEPAESTATLVPITTADTAITTPPPAADAAVDDPGRQAFTRLGCAMCHAVSSAGIAARTEVGPDLAGVSSRRGGQDLAAYVSGNEHPGEWRGTPEQAAAIGQWLAQQ